MERNVRLNMTETGHGDGKKGQADPDTDRTWGWKERRRERLNLTQTGHGDGKKGQAEPDTDRTWGWKERRREIEFIHASYLEDTTGQPQWRQQSEHRSPR